MYSIGNEIPDTGRPSGAAVGRAIAERIRALDDTRLVTNSINPMLVVRDRAVRVARAAGVEVAPTEDTGINTMMTMMEQYLPIILQHEVVDERTAESYAYLDVAGYNYTESRYAMDHELHPQRVIVGSENRPAVDRRELATGARAPARDRRLHLDRLGLPRRGRHRARAVRRSPRSSGGFMGDVPVAHRPLRRLRHHRAPPPGVVLARDRVGSARRRRTSRCGRPRTTAKRRRPAPAGRSPTRSRRGRGPASRTSRSRSRCTPTPTRSSCSSTARPSVERRVGETTVPRRVRDHVHARRAHRGRVPRRRRRPVACRWPRRAVPCCSTCRSTATRIDADDRDLAYVEIALVDADGNVAPARTAR